MSNGIHFYPLDHTATVDMISAVYPDGAQEALTATAPACSTNKYLSVLDATSNAVAATLADGEIHGQMKKVAAKNVDNAVTLTLANPVSTSLDVITFTVVGDYAILQWNEEDGYWRILELNNEACTYATPTVA